MVRGSRAALGLSCVAGLGLTLFSYVTSPARVPVHYGVTGVPDRWRSPLDLLIAYGCIIGIGTVLFLVLPELLRRAPLATISIPNKDYWLSPEHRDEATAKLATWSNMQGTAVNLLMITLQLLLAPNTSAAAEPSTFPALALVGFGVFTLAGIVWLSLAYRLPARP